MNRLAKKNVLNSSVRVAWAVIAATVLVSNLQAMPTPDTVAEESLEFRVQQGEAEITTKVDRLTAQVADKIRLTLTVKVPEGVVVSLPASPTSLGPFDVVGVSDQSDIPLGDQRSWTRVFELESLTSGVQEIPGITVAYTDRRHGASRHETITSKRIPITISSVLEGQVDPTQFRGFKGVVDLPIQSSPSRVGWWIGGGVGLAVAILLLVGTLRKRQHLNAEQWALAELDRLVLEQHLLKGRIPLFYARLTDIVRIYVERRFEIAAPRLTTDEFLRDIRDHKILEREHAQLLQSFLTQADVVKFANYCPAGSAGNVALDTVRRFVEETASTCNQSETNPANQED